ncbi:unnamed protein product [Pleuronectes platessa]|uniref:Uncharacterized protein n=1 Tax=Pleuronectes platessa TaxID=8262 RepID=A0A9N7TI30_PLEPL|nr:unnamed protein product [Pleuronectes platessa]
MNPIEELFSAWRWKVYERNPQDRVPLLQAMEEACGDGQRQTARQRENNPVSSTPAPLILSALSKAGSPQALTYPLFRLSICLLPPPSPLLILLPSSTLYAIAPFLPSLNRLLIIISSFKATC